MLEKAYPSTRVDNYEHATNANLNSLHITSERSEQCEARTSYRLD